MIEVVCGVLFGSLEQMFVPHLGIFWQSLRDQFPKAQEADPLMPVVESFEREPSGEPPFIAQLPLPRTWFVSGDERNLIQLQRDRFLYNWKRPDFSVEYPSYDNVIVEFEKYLDAFEDFVRTENLGELQYRQFELTYVNHIGTDMGLLQGEAGGGVLVDHVRDVSRDRFFPLPDSYRWATSYTLPNKAGRLHVTAQHATMRATGERLLRLELTARGIADKVSRSGMRAWFDLAHEWIVNGFADVTAAKIQDEVWRRIR